MIVRLTSAQHDMCKILGTPLHREWLDKAERAGKEQWDVPMPPIGWRTLLELLTAEAFNAYGQRNGRAPGPIHRAVQRISSGLAHVEAHPAFTVRVSLPGEHSEMFTGWPTGDGYSPYPRPGGDAVALMPEWHTAGGVRLTRWHPYHPSGWARAELDPEASLAFIDA